MEQQRKILITGGAGFIGSHVVRVLVTKYPHYKIFNLDKLTYAGNLENLRDVEASSNYQFIKGDIVDAPFIDALFREHKFNGVIHLAAESHVDRSIAAPMDFIMTNIVGTVNLLNAAKSIWQVAGSTNNNYRFHHVSTDEVFGSLGSDGLFSEVTRYDPKSPYAASKASADHLVRAYAHTYKLPTIITNCSNNYGPFHFPEKLIPLAIHNIRNMKPVPVYSQGENVRDWLYVEDHATAIDLVFHNGKTGSSYNIGGFNEWKNIDLIRLLCRMMDEKLNRAAGSSAQLITFVKDRPGHDMRYAIDSHKISDELGWKPSVTFEVGLSKTVDWYLQHDNWLKHVTSGDYLKYYDEQYHHR